MKKLNWNLKYETERLILRPLMPNDYESWYSGYSGREPQKYKYDEGQISMEDFDYNWFIGLCDRHQEQALSDFAYLFAIYSKDTQKHIGSIDISTIQREDKEWANLGYSIHNQFWGKGYGKESVSASLFAGFQKLGYHRIEAAINLDNVPSIALAKSVGLYYEGIRRGFYFENNQWTDHLIFVALPRDLNLAESSPEDSSANKHSCH